MAGKPQGYEEVSDRMVRFSQKYPEGGVRTHRIDFVEINGQNYVLIEARAYRSGDDTRPGTGSAMEPIPGTTPFTRNSEVEVCETSAWGRAMYSADPDYSGKKIATAEDVAVRVEEQKTEKPSPRGPKLQAELAKREIGDDKIKLGLAAVGVKVGNRSLNTVFKNLTDGEVNKLWNSLISE